VSLNSVDPVLKTNGRYRRFTPREAARIQSFPENFVLTGSDIRQYRAIGNAVPPVLMWHVAKAVIKAIRRASPKLLKEQPFRTQEEIRSYNMSMIRSRNTRPEMLLRSTLWSRGHRYRLHCKNVYGKPDIVFRKKRVAIFLDSAFWHGRDYEKTVSRIKTNKEYWENKIKRNMERDRTVTDVLQNLGWVVMRIWDDDLKDRLDDVVRDIEQQLEMAETMKQISIGQN
jgi:DNA mismatch endonuclease (patch repair protein)